MPRSIDWLPTGFEAFRDKQDVYFAMVVANKVAWGIPDAAIAPLLVLQAEFIGLYNIIKDKKNRTSAKVGLFHDCRKRFAKAWRLFHKEWVAFNSAISRDDMIILVGKDYDTSHSPHPAITEIPYPLLRVIGGGDLDARCRVTQDQTKASMLSTANLVEYRFALIEVGDIPPANPEDYPKKDVSSRARFVIHAGAQNDGKKFWAIFRWVNTHKPAQVGPWSDSINVTVA